MCESAITAEIPKRFVSVPQEVLMKSAFGILLIGISVIWTISLSKDLVKFINKG